VTIDGGLDAGYQSIDYKGAKVNAIGGNGSSTSQINFRGTSDLGGGLKANFRVETDWNVVSNKANTGFINGTDQTGAAAATSAKIANANSGGGTFGNGELRVGLSSNSWGAVDLGAVNFNTLTTVGVGQPYGTAIGGGFRGVLRSDSGTMAASAVRADNSIKYVTPAFSGVTGTLYKVQKSTKAAAGTSAAPASTYSNAFDFSTTIGAYDYAGVTELGLNYANGPLNASFSNQKTDNLGTDVIASAASTKRTLNTLGANYTVGPVVAYALYQNFKTESATAAVSESTYQAFSAKYTTGNHVLMASMGTYTQDLSSTAALIGKKSKLSSIGYDYNLSKTTALYARMESIKDEAKAITAVPTLDVTADGKRTRTAIGLRTTF
jgi:predicted porin